MVFDEPENRFVTVTGTCEHVNLRVMMVTRNRREPKVEMIQYCIIRGKGQGRCTLNVNIAFGLCSSKCSS